MKRICVAKEKLWWQKNRELGNYQDDILPLFLMQTQFYRTRRKWRNSSREFIQEYLFCSTYYGPCGFLMSPFSQVCLLILNCCEGSPHQQVCIHQNLSIVKRGNTMGSFQSYLQQQTVVFLNVDGIFSMITIYEWKKAR